MPLSSRCALRAAAALGLALAIGGAAQAQEPAARPDELSEYDKLLQNDPSLQQRGDGSVGVAEDRSFYRTSRPRSPKAMGFGASPTDPYRDQTRPGLIYDEVLQTFREPFTPDR
jgi:hypothetical protein